MPSGEETFDGREHFLMTWKPSWLSIDRARIPQQLIVDRKSNKAHVAKDGDTTTRTRTTSEHAIEDNFKIDNMGGVPSCRDFLALLTLVDGQKATASAQFSCRDCRPLSLVCES